MDVKKRRAIGLLDIILAGWLAAGLAFIIIEISYVVFDISTDEASYALIVAFNVFPQLLSAIAATYFLNRRVKMLSAQSALLLALVSSALYTVVAGGFSIYSVIAFLIGSYLGTVLVGKREGFPDLRSKK